LADLDADIEGNERQHKMIAGKLQFVAQRKREPEAMNEPENARDEPAPRKIRRDQVFERHVDDR
jgi:hypothetical protein